MSCAGNGYLTENSLSSYPFEDGQQVSCGDDELLAIQRCFADAEISIFSESFPDSGWPSIGNFSVSSGSLSFTLSVGGKETELSVSDSGDSFPIVDGKASWGRYVLILSAEGIRSISSPPSQGSSSPSAMEGDFFLRLCARCVTLAPSGLKSIMVYDGVNAKSSGPHFVLKGDVTIRPGNNMLLSDPGENGIEIGAVTGAGMGKVACWCEKTTQAKKALAGPDGHARIFNDTCYDLEPAEFDYISVDGEPRMSRKLRIHAKCTACCQCSMYESFVNERLAPMSDVLRKAKADIGVMFGKYEDAVKKFNMRMSRPTLADFSLTLAGMPIGRRLSPALATTGVRGKMSRCAFTATLRNSSFFRAWARINSMSATDSIVESSASWSREDGTPLSKTVDGRFGMVGERFLVYPGRSLVVTFVSTKDDMVGEVETGGFEGSISIGLSSESGSIGNIERTVNA